MSALINATTKLMADVQKNIVTLKFQCAQKHGFTIQKCTSQNCSNSAISIGTTTNIDIIRELGISKKTSVK